MPEYYSKKVVIPMAGLPVPDIMYLDYYPRKENLMFYELGIRGDDGDDIFFRVFPEIGFKCSGLTYRGKAIEPNDPAFFPFLYLSAAWGSYLPYPTPNRVRNGVFTFRGETVRMEKYGELRDAHGLAYDTVWNYTEPVIEAESVKIRGWFDIAPGDENYPSFPYKSRITVEYRLTKDCLLFNYRVDNLDEKAMPYGLCRHPFFLVPTDGERVEVKLEAEDTYETTPDLLPTGNFLPVADHPATDLRSFREVRQIKLDTVFTHLRSDSAYVRYPERGYQLRIQSSPEFRNVVVFTSNAYDLDMPNDMPRTFCIENQTCCTDGINMHEKGFSESGLIILEPGQSKEGFLAYRFEKL